MFLRAATATRAGRAPKPGPASNARWVCATSTRSCGSRRLHMTTMVAWCPVCLAHSGGERSAGDARQRAVPAGLRSARSTRRGGQGPKKNAQMRFFSARAFGGPRPRGLVGAERRWAPPSFNNPVRAALSFQGVRSYVIVGLFGTALRIK